MNPVSAQPGWEGELLVGPVFRGLGSDEEERYTGEDDGIDVAVAF
jgi:hypothetical protein